MTTVATHRRGRVMAVDCRDCGDRIVMGYGSLRVARRLIGTFGTTCAKCKGLSTSPGGTE